MAEFRGGKEKPVRENEPIVFENKTDSDFDVSTGIVFHKSGIYEISIVGRRTVVSKVTEPKTGKWIPQKGGGCCCSECGRYALDEVDENFIHVSAKSKYCPHCGVMMLKEGEEHD